MDRQKEERVAVEKSVEGMRRKVMEEKRRELTALQRRADRRLAALHKKQKKELSRVRCVPDDENSVGKWLITYENFEKFSWISAPFYPKRYKTEKIFCLS